MQHASRYIKSSVTSFVMSTPLLFASSFALAQDSGFYAGISIGESRGHISRSDVTQTLQENGREVSLLNISDEEEAWKALIGYDFNRILAVEFSHFDLGAFEFNSALVPSQNLRGRANVEGFGLDLVATIPMTDKLSGLARGGLTRTSVTQSFSAFPRSPTGFSNRTPRENKVKVGVGLEYDFSDALSARAEYEHYRLPSNQITRHKANFASVGLVYRFGRTAAPAPVEPTPAPTQTPAPAPAQTPEPTPPPAPEPVSVTLESNALFDFDTSGVSAAGRQELDALLRQIDDLDYEAVIVVGHTDRIGSREYNLDLSERRAEAVRDYLVEGGIPENRITARGVGNDESLLETSDCRGLGSNAATIECLAPDRRVVVEIDGTREP